MKIKSITPKEVIQYTTNLTKEEKKIELIIDTINRKLIEQRLIFSNEEQEKIKKQPYFILEKQIRYPNLTDNQQSIQDAEEALKAFENYWIIERKGEWDTGNIISFIPKAK